MGCAVGRQTQCKRRKRADESERRSDKRMTGEWVQDQDSLLDVGAKRVNQEDTVDGRGLGVRHLVFALLSAKARQLA